MSGASPARWARASPRRRSGPRPELFPVRDDPRAARFPALPARRPAQGGGARGRSRAAARRRRQARQPGHLLRPGRRLCPRRREGAAQAAQDGDVVDRDGRVLGRHRGLVHFTVGQRRGWRSAASPSRSTCSGSSPGAGASSSVRRRAGRALMRLEGINWLGEDQSGDLAVKVRSLARPAPASFDGSASPSTGPNMAWRPARRRSSTRARGCSAAAGSRRRCRRSWS